MIILLLIFVLIIYKLILHEEVIFEDLVFIDTPLYNSLKNLKDMNIINERFRIILFNRTER